jgi:hypothetical protein
MKKVDLNLFDVVDVTIDGGIETGIVQEINLCNAKIELFDEDNEVLEFVTVPFKDIQPTA